MDRHDRTRSRVILGPVLAALLGSLGCEAMPTSAAEQVAEAPRPRAVSSELDTPPPTPLTAVEEATVALFERVRPSVVYITTLSRRRDFFTGASSEVPSGTGSGFVWDREGRVVTNLHVLQDANAADVVLEDQNSYRAKLVGFSRGHDLAVVQIDAPAEALHPVEVGRSDTLRVGQSIFAIGNPFGLSATLTTGVVSAIGREIPARTGATIENVIQTDAAINPGNSGGPLLDSSGRLIGINTAIYSPSGASAGIGFAVPVDTIRRVVPQIIERGEYTPPELGISVNDDLNEYVRRRLGLTGVVVSDVDSGTGADRAGLRGISRVNGRFVLGDIIQAIDGQPVSDSGDLWTVLDHYRPGDQVTVTVLRDRSAREVSIEVD